MNRLWILTAVMAVGASAALAQGAAPASGKAPPNVGAPTTGNQPTDALPHGGMAPYGKAPAKTATQPSNMRVAAASPTNAKTPNPTSAAAAPHVPTAANAKSSGPDKSAVKCLDGSKSTSKTAPCATKRGVDTAVLAAEAQPGETSSGPGGKAPVTNAVPAGKLTPK